MLKLPGIFLAALLAGQAQPPAQPPVQPAPAQPPPQPAPAAPAGQAQPQASRPAAVSQLAPKMVCGLPIPEPSRLPPAGSGPVVYQVVPCFQKQGGSPAIDPATYLYYIQLHGSRPSENVWVPYDEK